MKRPRGSRFWRSFLFQIGKVSFDQDVNSLKASPTLPFHQRLLFFSSPLTSPSIFADEHSTNVSIYTSRSTHPTNMAIVKLVCFPITSRYQSTLPYRRAGDDDGSRIEYRLDYKGRQLREHHSPTTLTRVPLTMRLCLESRHPHT